MIRSHSTHTPAAFTNAKNMSAAGGMWAPA